MKYTIPKGVFDILPQEKLPEDAWRTSDHWQYVEEKMRQIAHLYGFKEIRTPIFEHTDLFVRGVGESSDIVSKEMYTFQDRAERFLSLRPEGTAPVMRAFVEKHLHQMPGAHKYFYIGPMFRYERPQAGRFRQHHQFGAEAVGIGLPEQDVEMVDLLCELYRQLGLKNLVVNLNSIGDEETRTAYRNALTQYLQPHFDRLSADSKVRFSKNILRILDSKDPEDQKILSHAPSILTLLSAESKDHFEKVQQLLNKLNIRYVLNPKLVRGLDYYNKTVFEITSGELGAQNSIGGGGRFDGLLSLLGGPNLPAVGFATGIERLLQTMAAQRCYFPPPPHPFVFLVSLGEAAKEYCVDLLFKLRHAGVAAEMDLQGKKVGQALQLADQLQAEYSVVIGDEELKSGQLKLKEMKTRQETTLALKELAPILLEK
ncbi:MAG TPA: histidine--tRNA ligase, partial [Rhabdochlamydiaceae bacterium]|nr:histidine--tRNA ligase [Rhabdochlamydiaceae bacterium]